MSKGPGTGAKPASGYRAVFEASEQGVFIHDVDTGQIIDINPAACRMHGYSRDEMMRLDVERFSFGKPPFTQDRALELIHRAREKPQRFEWLAKRKDGEPLWVRVVLKRVRMDDRDVIVAFVDDITESKRGEEREAIRRRRHSALFSAAMDPMVMINETGRITDFNAAAERCFGYRRQDAVGQPISDLIIPKRHRRGHHDGLLRYLETVPRPNLNRRFRVTALDAHGVEFPVELTLTTVGGTSDSELIATIRDLSEQYEADEERARVEEQMRRVHTMEALGQLTASVAGDFEEILTEISGHITMARARNRRAQGDGHDEYLQLAARATERARELMSQMLMFSRGQKGDTVAFELGPLIRDTVKGLSESFPSNIEVRLDFGGRVPVVDFNPVQAAQIVVDLCANARDALQPDGGTIRIRLQPVSLATRVCSSCHKRIQGAYLSLIVEDDGSGIEPETLPRIFEPFFTTKRPRKGSGMGLAKTHGIVHEHGGHMLVDSGDGGSVFQVLMPLSEDSIRKTRERDAEREAAADTELSGCAMVVDDDPQNLEATARLLRRWGLKPVTFLDAREAQDWFEAEGERIDIALLDQTMPGVSGAALAAELLERDPKLPVILCASHAEEAAARAAAPEEVLSVQTKPLDPDRLRMVLEAVLDM